MSLYVFNAMLLPRRCQLVLTIALTILIVCAAGVVCLAQDSASPDAARDEAVAPDDLVARLQKQINSGQIALQHDSRRGYLPAVLKALRVPVSSQTLVFSKTSFQRERISPWQPRALYFNDDIYLSWVPGGMVLEVAAIDRRLGAVFYTLDQSQANKPRFRRQTDSCLVCHEGVMTQNVPGLMMRSLLTDPGGQPLFNVRNYLTTDASPFAQRWGGWYVTGSHGSMRHLGNLLFHKSDDPENPDRQSGANLSDLSAKFDTATYLSPGSDIVALMVLAHQTQIHNLITKVGSEYQAALRDGELAQQDSHSEQALPMRVKNACEQLLRGLLFSGEAPLTDHVSGSTSFAGDFAAASPRDAAGRSLRDFDLNTRLFKYPCSYLIYSDSFASLAPPAKQLIYGRLHEILGGKDNSKDFAHLSAADRQAIDQILAATLKDYRALELQG
jgi:hypothetical protein